MRKILALNDCRKAFLLGVGVAVVVFLILAITNSGVYIAKPRFLQRSSQAQSQNYYPPVQWYSDGNGQPSGFGFGDVPGDSGDGKVGGKCPPVSPYTVRARCKDGSLPVLNQETCKWDCSSDGDRGGNGDSGECPTGKQCVPDNWVCSAPGGGQCPVICPAVECLKGDNSTTCQNLRICKERQRECDQRS